MGDALRYISENVAIISNREDAKYMGKSYMEVLHPPKEETRTAEEIIDGIKNKLRAFE